MQLTYDDYVHIPEDGRRHEILDGEHFVSPAPSVRHQEIARNLVLLIAPHVRRKGLGQILFAPVDVVLSRHDVVQPDLLFISRQRSHIQAEENVQGAPDLLIEILSPSTQDRDLGLKREQYALHGVEEYWAVDPRDKTARAFRRQGRHLRLAAVLSAEAGDALSSPLLPGLEVPLREVFESEGS